MIECKDSILKSAFNDTQMYFKRDELDNFEKTKHNLKIMFY